MCVTERGIVRVVPYSHRTQKQIAMATNILCQRLHGDVDAMGKGVEEDTCRIRVVECEGHASAMGGRSDRGDILHFHRHRAGTLAPDQLRIVTDHGSNLAADQWLVVLTLHAKPREQSVC